MNDIARFDISHLMGDEIHIKSGDYFLGVQPHCHDYYELIYYRDADVECSINGNCIRLGNGSVYLLTPFDFHKTVNLREDGSISFINISFSKDAVGCEVINRITSPTYIEESTEFDPICRLLNLMSDCSKRIRGDERRYLLCALLNLVLAEGKKLTDGKMSVGTSFAKRVCEYISDHFSEQLTLDDIAGEMHLAPTYFSTLFSKTLGCTFINYLSTVRLNYAKQLLVYSDKSITAICFECGFSSLSHFLREFKKQNGMTPTEFRNKRLSR